MATKPGASTQQLPGLEVRDGRKQAPPGTGQGLKRVTEGPGPGVCVVVP